MAKRGVASGANRLLERLRCLANFQKSCLNHPTRAMQQCTDQKALLARELGKHLRAWVEDAEARVLISVALVHSPEDFGSGAKMVAQADRTRISRIQQQILSRAISTFWKDLRSVLPNLRPDKVYQDGLLVYDERPELVVVTVDQTQTPNYALLRTLRDQGSEIMGTESLPLLLQEKERLECGIFNSGRDGLLQQRDAFIADRITQTLHAKEVGLLLIGALHQIVFPENLGIWKIDLPTVLEGVF